MVSEKDCCILRRADFDLTWTGLSLQRIRWPCIRLPKVRWIDKRE